LEKPSSLDHSEWEIVKQHPYYSSEILRRVSGFEELSSTAAAHHEKLDGTGYFRHLSAEQLSPKARILVVADIFDALSAKRPYRDAMPLDKVFGIMRTDAPRAIDADCLEALIAEKYNAPQTAADLNELSGNLGRAQAARRGTEQTRNSADPSEAVESVVRLLLKRTEVSTSKEIEHEIHTSKR
jgi:HD-GYP domain-containing protein (c-di-GMP phosphodiesterase class II)